MIYNDALTEEQAEFQSEWVDALRSDLYEQGTNSLYNKISGVFCCLGVAGAKCGISREELMDQPLPQPAWMSGRFLEVTGMREDYLTSVVGPDGDPVTIYALNDNWKLTFKEIADLVEEGVVLPLDHYDDIQEGKNLGLRATAPH